MQTVGKQRGPAPAQARPGVRLGVAVLLLALAGTSQAASPTAAGLADCADMPFATVLLPANATDAAANRQADAYWLDRALLQWPGVDAGGVFKLYYSAPGRLRVSDHAIAGADGALLLQPSQSALPRALAERFKFVPAGALLQVAAADRARMPALHRGQLWLVHEDGHGKLLQATRVQVAGALDDLYAAAGTVADLGVRVGAGHTGFKLWAPTAQNVALCRFGNDHDAAQAITPMQRDDATGAWAQRLDGDLSGSYYRYLVDVFVPGVGLVRNRVSDPYSLSLGRDSRRSYVADLDAANLKPEGWADTAAPDTVHAQTDMVIYELHVRDFSASDASVPAAHRGKYLAFTDSDARGMRHLRALAEAGLTDVQLLPVFDFATVPEAGCRSPAIAGRADSPDQQAAVVASAAGDCFNWGYDPYHFNAPEGSYASDAGDGAVRIREFRQMVQALHRAGLRVGMDVVYNHTSASDQDQKSVLDRIVPGYYHRLDGHGVVERSTCCDNTATENLMMAKLMIDSARLWASQYRVDSFRFDLMAHQPRAVMERLRDEVDRATGRKINLIGEGWNYGEVADGARFVQASQLSLNGSGIGTFSDRARDAIRGGSAGDSGEALVSRQGYVNGLVYAPNVRAPKPEARELLQAADLVRVGLAGSLRSFRMQTWDDSDKPLQQVAYGAQPAGYASEPAEVVNYVENHDNLTLFDANAYKLPLDTSREDRARVQLLAIALDAFSQGVAYFHAGIDSLRSKSLDRNSYDSGDWFNRLDWSYQDNHFGTGLPPAPDNGKDYALSQPLLANPAIKPTAREIAFARDGFRDLLRIRASSGLFRLRSSAEVQARLKFYNTGARQNPVLIAGHLDGAGLPGAGFRELLYLVNVAPVAQSLRLPQEAGKAYRLHPVHLAPGAADPRPAAQARYERDDGRFLVPARTALVYVVN
jgi:pullulanase/glycogen debranching enzyme